MPELIDRWLKCQKCGGHFALLLRNVEPLERISAFDVVHLDGRPIFPFDEIVCDSCGDGDDFVLVLPRSVEARE
jgi:hypothetical protein